MTIYNTRENCADWVLSFKVIEKKFDAKQEENTILHFFHGDRKISDNDLRKGIKIPKGSTLDFVVTERQTGMVSIPSVVCQKYEAAYFYDYRKTI